MVFAKRLREGVRRGEITCSVRIWTRPHVKVGGKGRDSNGQPPADPGQYGLHWFHTMLAVGVAAFPVPWNEQACPGSSRLEIDLEDFNLVINVHHHGVQRPFAAIKQVREFRLNVHMVVFTSAG